MYCSLYMWGLIFVRAGPPDANPEPVQTHRNSVTTLQLSKTPFRAETGAFLQLCKHPDKLRQTAQVHHHTCTSRFSLARHRNDMHSMCTLWPSYYHQRFRFLPSSCNIFPHVGAVLRCTRFRPPAVLMKLVSSRLCCRSFLSSDDEISFSHSILPTILSTKRLDPCPKWLCLRYYCIDVSNRPSSHLHSSEPVFSVCLTIRFYFKRFFDSCLFVGSSRLALFCESFQHHSKTYVYLLYYARCSMTEKPHRSNTIF